MRRECSWDDPCWHASLSPRILALLRGGGIVHEGDLTRLSNVVRRARVGQPLMLTAIGSSMTADYAGMDAGHQDRAELALPGTPGACKRGCVKFGWLLSFFRFLVAKIDGEGNERAHVDDKATQWIGMHRTFVNAGVPGHPLRRYLECTPTLVPHDADVIIVDAANILERPNMIEKVVRRLMQLPKQPALIFLNFMHWCNPLHQGRMRAGDKSRLHRNGSCYEPHRLHEADTMAGRAEHYGDDVARRYNLTVLSMRRAFYDSIRNASISEPDIGSIPSVFAPMHLKPAEVLHRERPKQLLHPRFATYDGLHPTRIDLPAGWQYVQLISWLLASFVHDRWDALVSGPCPLSSSISARSITQCVPPPLPCPSGYLVADQDAEASAVLERCYTWARDSAIKSNAPSVQAAHGASRRRADTLVVQPLPGTVGFFFTEFDNASSATGKCEARGEARASCERSSKPRPGFTSFTAGSTAAFVLAGAPVGLQSEAEAFREGGDADGDADGPTSSAPAQVTQKHRVNGTLTIEYLSSYEGMGIATVRCSDGCECDETRFDGHRGPETAQRLVSIMESHLVAVRGLDSRTPTCTVNVSVLADTRSGRHKVKLGAARLSWGHQRSLDRSTADRLGDQGHPRDCLRSCIRKGKRQHSRNASGELVCVRWKWVPSVPVT
jgi:hypothetical protein